MFDLFLDEILSNAHREIVGMVHCALFQYVSGNYNWKGALGPVNGTFPPTVFFF